MTTMTSGRPTISTTLVGMRKTREVKEKEKEWEVCPRAAENRAGRARLAWSSGCLRGQDEGKGQRKQVSFLLPSLVKS